MFRDFVDPAKFGVVLTYALATTTSELAKLTPRRSTCNELTVRSVDETCPIIRILRARDGKSIASRSGSFRDK